MTKWIFILFISCLSPIFLLGQCNGYDKNQSNKIANYTIEVVLDNDAKKASCIQKLNWKNSSPDTIYSLKFYMYMNAFQNNESSYLRRAGRSVFGQDLLNRPKEEWGYITITTMKDEAGNDLSERQQYIQPNDKNLNDESVLEVYLEQPLLPGEIATYDIDFVVKLPKTIVRAGYGKNDYYLFVHWFPQLGVYEENKDGVWAWNCHQFLPNTEFYADFGDYDVTIDAPSHLVIGGSGCKQSVEVNGDRQIIHFVAHDLIDFGWVAYPDFDVYHHVHHNIDIEILMPPEHCAFADRYLEAVIHGLDYMTENVGPFPFPKITIVDPPVHTLNSGFMEYPMMVTGASFYGIPSSVRSVESLVIHEFNHMYFMASLASNEKEEAWLDEGFVTYYEDRVLDHYHGDKNSFFDVLGFASGNAENSRLEYVGLSNPSVDAIAKPGWELRGPYKGLIYAKASCVLRTLEGLVSRPVMDKIIKAYYEKYKFSHPTEEDFIEVVNAVLNTHKAAYDFDVTYFFNETLHNTSTIDYAILDAETTQVVDGYMTKYRVKNLGTFALPADVVITFDDGSTKEYLWQGKDDSLQIIESDVPLVSIVVDPAHHIDLDLNFNNNGYLAESPLLPKLKYTTKSISWMQTLLEFTTYLF